MGCALKPDLQAPYVWFGGKAAIAVEVWRRFGKVRGYVEPFFGSGAVLLARSQPFAGVETVNDLDGMVSNFWRAVTADPRGVARHADWPVLENDLHARHRWLVGQKAALQERLEADPDYYNAKIAGWWAWGLAVWVGSGFCSKGKPVRQIPNITCSGQGIKSKARRGALREWLGELAARFADVRVCCGDWTRVCGGRTGNALSHFFVAGAPCGVFLDPPYDGTEGLYAGRSIAVSQAVREWAIAHGNDQRLRIALCGHDGDHVMPAGWDVYYWSRAGGMEGTNKADEGKTDKHRERVWFSPYCLRSIKSGLGLH
jgi:DNA adenine methylase